MINLFVTEEGVITKEFLENEGCQFAELDILEDLNYKGEEGKLYQLIDGVYVFQTKGTQETILRESELWTEEEISECEDVWLALNKDVPKLYLEFIKIVDEWEEIESLNFNTDNTYMEAITKVETDRGIIRYISNCLLKDGEVSINTVMLH